MNYKLIVTERAEERLDGLVRYLLYQIKNEQAAEIIYTRADSSKNHMGLSTWKKIPDGKILKSDVAIAKNYLWKEELDDLRED